MERVDIGERLLELLNGINYTNMTKLTTIGEDLIKIEDQYSVLYSECVECLNGWSELTSPHYIYVYVEELTRIENDGVSCNFDNATIWYKLNYKNVGRFAIALSYAEERN